MRDMRSLSVKSMSRSKTRVKNTTPANRVTNNNYAKYKLSKISNKNSPKRRKITQLGNQSKKNVIDKRVNFSNNYQDGHLIATESYNIGIDQEEQK